MMHKSGLIVGLVGVWVTSLGVGAAPENLGAALRFHASFDEALTVDYSKGAQQIRQFATRAERRAGGAPATLSETTRIEPESGRYGGALALTSSSPVKLFVPSAGILDGGADEFSGTVSVWLRTTPDEDIGPYFCDPVMFTSDDYKKGMVFIEWSKDHVPKRFRYVIWPDTPRWNPEDKPWESIPDAERPMVQLDHRPFSREKWVHVVFTYERINAGKKGRGALYLDGQPMGTIAGWDLTMGWDPATLIIALGWSYGGLMDDLAIFDRALSDEEIGQLHRLPHGVKALVSPMARTAPAP